MKITPGVKLEIVWVDPADKNSVECEPGTWDWGIIEKHFCDKNWELNWKAKDLFVMSTCWKTIKIVVDMAWLNYFIVNNK